MVENNKQIKFSIAGKECFATLNESKAAADFLDLLPLELELKDFAQMEKVSDLPKNLNTDDSPKGSSAQRGDIAYYKPWGNLAIFYKYYKYAEGLVILGHIEEDLEVLLETANEKVTIELINYK